MKPTTTREQTPSDEEFTNLSEAFYTTPDHGYVKKAIEIALEVDLAEVLESDGPHGLRQYIHDVFLTSNAKRKKVEVNERYLTLEEKRMFREAKKKEWMSFIENNVVELAVRTGIDPLRIVGSRWVLTWKTTDSEKTPGQKSKVPKARLVLLGYQDPDLGEYTRSSPTLTRTGRTLLFALIAQFQWKIFSLDAKNAFLAGDISSRNKPLYTMVPKDLIEIMNLPQDAVFRLKKSAYGLAEAPIAWFKCLRAKLENIGWKPHPLDECVMTLYDKEGSVKGLIGIHVDDLLVGGEGSFFEAQMKRLETELPFGSRKFGKFTYTGIQVSQQGTGPITVDSSCHANISIQTNVSQLQRRPTLRRFVEVWHGQL